MLEVKDKHADHIALLEYWNRARHTSGGELVMHSQGETYLPKLDRQTKDQYASYKLRARFLNAMRRTVTGLTGLVFRKEASVELPAGMDIFEQDVTLNNQSLHDYVQDLFEEKLTVGAGGTLVDHPKAEPNMTVAQAEARNMRPIFVFYPTESIINWRYEVVNNISTLVEVVLKEEYVDTDGEARVQYRHLLLIDGVYLQIVEKEKPKPGEEKLTQVDVTMNNASLGYIPFVFHRTTTKLHFIHPPLTDLVDMNIHHYQIKADHSHGLRYVALPTPYITGVSKPEKEDEETMVLGGQTIWFIGSDSAKVGMLEFTGAGLKAFQEELGKLEQQMAQAGARILAPDDRLLPETATAALLDAKAEDSLLAKITNITSTEVTRILSIAAQWMNKDGDSVEYKLPTDFLPLPIDAQTLSALVGAWQSGGISFETLFENLKAGEIIAPSKTLDEEKAAIEGGDPISQNNSTVLDNEEEEVIPGQEDE